MCLGHKLRPCEKLAKEDKGDLSRVASEASATALKGKLLHETELTLLPGREVRSRRPASAPCVRKTRDGSGTTLGGVATKAATEKSQVMQSDLKTQQPFEKETEEVQPTEVIKDVSSETASQIVRPKSAPQNQRTVTPLVQQFPQVRPQSAGTWPKHAPVHSGSHPSVGSALRVGTDYEHIARERRHAELRQWPSGKANQSTNTLPKRASRPQSAPVGGVRPSVGNLRIGTEYEHIARERYHDDMRQWPSSASAPDFAEHNRSCNILDDFEARLQVLEQRHLFQSMATLA